MKLQTRAGFFDNLPPMAYDEPQFLKDISRVISKAGDSLLMDRPDRKTGETVGADCKLFMEAWIPLKDGGQAFVGRYELMPEVPVETS